MKRKNRSAGKGFVISLVVVALVGVCVFSLYSLGKQKTADATVAASDSNGTGRGKLLTRIDEETDDTAVAYVTESAGEELWQYDDADSWTASSDPRDTVSPYDIMESSDEETEGSAGSSPETEVPQDTEETESSDDMESSETEDGKTAVLMELDVKPSSVIEALSANTDTQDRTADMVVKTAQKDSGEEDTEITAEVEDEMRADQAAMMAAASELAFGPHNMDPELYKPEQAALSAEFTVIVPSAEEPEAPVEEPEEILVNDSQIVEETYEEIVEETYEEPVYEEAAYEEPAYEESEFEEPEEIFVDDSQVNEDTYEEEQQYGAFEYEEPEYEEPEYEEPEEILVYDSQIDEESYAEEQQYEVFEYEEPEYEEPEADAGEGGWVYDYDLDEWVYVENDYSQDWSEEEADYEETESEEYSEEGEWVYDYDLDEWVYAEYSSEDPEEEDPEDEPDEFDEEYSEEYEGEEEPAYSGLGQEIVNYAMGFVGVTPYVPGGRSLSGGTDCSGFVSLIFGDFGIYCSPASLAYDGSSFGYIIDYDEARAGDIAVYGGGDHVAIYAGDGYVVHCSSPENGTVYWNMNYRSDLSWFLRVID